jgi:hypothetical protein
MKYFQAFSCDNVELVSKVSEYVSIFIAGGGFDEMLLRNKIGPRHSSSG